MNMIIKILRRIRTILSNPEVHIVLVFLTIFTLWFILVCALRYTDPPKKPVTAPVGVEERGKVVVIQWRGDQTRACWLLGPDARYRFESGMSIVNFEQSDWIVLTGTVTALRVHDDTTLNNMLEQLNIRADTCYQL